MKSPSPSPANLKALIKTITPPKGVKRGFMEDIPPDEGRELHDCEGEEESLENIETEDVEDDDADTTVSRRNENAVAGPLNAVEEME